MTRQEIEKKIDEVNTKYFILQMKDGWTSEDYELEEQLEKEMKELDKQLEKAVSDEM